MIKLFSNKKSLYIVAVFFSLIFYSDRYCHAADFKTTAGGMTQWTSGEVDLTQTNAWYDVPKLSYTIYASEKSLWRIHSNVRYRFIPQNNGDYCSVRLRLLVDGKEANVIGVVFNPPATAGMEEINQHMDIEAIVQLEVGDHKVSTQVLKWQDAASSHIDIIADINGYSSATWQKINE